MDPMYHLPGLLSSSMGHQGDETLLSPQPFCLRNEPEQSTVKYYTLSQSSVMPHAMIFLQRQEAYGESLLTNILAATSQLESKHVNNGDFTTLVGYIFQYVISSFSIPMFVWFFFSLIYTHYFFFVYTHSYLSNRDTCRPRTICLHPSY